MSRLLLGPALPTRAERAERLGNPEAFAVLSADALSSVAFATEEMVKVLVPIVGIAAFAHTLRLSGLVLLLLLTLVLSYRETIRAYPNVGGTYAVARDNFGPVTAQVAGAALLTDYIACVAVCISAGTAAMYSQFPALFAYRVPISVALIWLVTLANLRGTRMTGRLFSIPAYLFVASVLVLLAAGAARAVGGGLHQLPPPDGVAFPPEATAVGLFALLHAYAVGATALTGVEAVSNAVTAFRPPEVENARKVETLMGVLLAVMFAGITLLAWRVHPVPTPDRTLVSELGTAVFGNGPIGGFGRLLLQVTTTAILVLAANTAFSDFPRLAGFQARDGFLPRPLRRRGRRLVNSTGILTLAVVATILVVAFGADVHRLIPLFAVGVFASFTLSAAGMSLRNWRLREDGWRLRLGVNATGAVGSGGALAAVSVATFGDGAWVVVVLVPVAVAVFLAIHRHYQRTDRRLADVEAADERLDAMVVMRSPRTPTDAALAYARAVRPDLVRVEPGSTGRLARLLSNVRQPGGRVLVLDGGGRRVRRLARRADVAAASVGPAGWDELPAEPIRQAVVVLVGEAMGLTRRSLALARALHPTEAYAVYVDIGVDGESRDRVVDDWHRCGFDLPLEVLAAPYRERGGPVRVKVETLHRDGVGIVTVVAPEVAPRWWQRPLYHSDARRVRAALRDVPRTAVIEDVIAL